MATSRPTPQQVLTSLSLEAARESAWQALRESNVQTPVIDREQSIVTGTTGDGFVQATRQVVVSFQTQSDGATLITVASKPVMAGSIDLGGAKSRARKIADAIEKVVARGGIRAPDSTSPFAGPGEVPADPYAPAAPIAAPGAPVVPQGGPIYARAMPAKQGTTLIIYAILGLTCCPIAAPFAWYYAAQALRNYGALDPGDRSTVVIARILGIVGCVLGLGRLLLRFGMMGNGPAF